MGRPPDQPGAGVGKGPPPGNNRPPNRATRGGSVPKRSPGPLGRPSMATTEKGERLYKMIRERLATRVLGAPVA